MDQPPKTTVLRANALSVDVEDYFHVHAYQNVLDATSWETLPSTLENNLKRLLDILDSQNVRATFFVLGWVAKRYPSLIKETSDRGHEIGCHGYMHRAIYLNDRKHFRNDIGRAKQELEDITGKRVLGYRAPTYSIIQKTLWALEILAETGFVYDTSIFPVRHDLYGIPGAHQQPYFLNLNGSELQDQIFHGGDSLSSSAVAGDMQGIVEFPISVLHLGRFSLPFCGGGYFRLWPYPLTRWALKRIERDNGLFMFYLHPWELSPSLPSVPKASWKSRFRTNVNLHTTERKLKQLLEDFRFQPVNEVLQQKGLAFWENG